MFNEMSSVQAAISDVETWGAGHFAALVLDSAGTTTSCGERDRVFQIASVTKIASAIAVLTAVEDKSIFIDDAVGPPGATVRHLLCHAGGYAFDSRKVISEPGTRRIYSNTGYEVLADHVSQRTGIAFDEYLDEAVLDPLGMTSSGLQGSAAKDLHSSAADLALLAKELLSPTLLDKSTWAEATTPQFPDLVGVVPGFGRQDPCPWGYGPEIKGHKSPHWMGADAPPETFGHFGGRGTFLWVDPTKRIGCVVLTDRPFGDWAVEAWPTFSDRVRRALVGESAQV